MIIIRLFEQLVREAFKKSVTFFTLGVGRGVKIGLR